MSVSVKKYKFTTILKEYNNVYGETCSLDSDITTATIIYDFKKGIFTITFKIKEDSCLQGRTLLSFINKYTHPVVSATKLFSLIKTKMEDKSKIEIKILPSSKIRYAYLGANYFSSAGDLGKSCMRHKSSQKSLNFYIKNNVKIVVLIDSNNKIHARALLWENVKSAKLKKPFTYLDRVYANSTHLVTQFHTLTEKNNWKYYSGMSAGNAINGLYIDNLDITGVCHMPWVDTFKFLYYENNLAISGGTIPCLGHLGRKVGLNHTDGTIGGVYISELDPNRVREVITGNYISKKDAIKVKRYYADTNQEGYVLKTNIANINGDYYSVHDNTVTSSELDGYILKKNSIPEVITQKTIDKTKATHSEKYNGFIHKSNIVCIEHENYHKEDNDIICFKINDTKKKWYHISQCFINYDRKEINKEIEKSVYTPNGNKEYVKQFVFSDNDLVQRCMWYSLFMRSYTCQSGPQIIKTGNLIPKEHAIIAYDLIYSSMLDKVIHQVVYYTRKVTLIKLNTGELIIDSSNNRKYLKKFNNKYYLKQDFKLPDKKQLTFNFED